MINDYSFLEQAMEQYLYIIKEDCRKILHDALMETVFSYNPSVYNRTGQLEDIDNIDFKIEGNMLYVYFNTDNMTYYSFGKGQGYNTNGLKEVDAEAVLHFLQSGHDVSGDYSRNLNSNDGYDYFYNYPSMNFLKIAQEKIKAKYPDLTVSIVQDQPNIY